MPFIGNQPAKVPLTSADITDGIIRQPNTPVATVSKYAKPFLMSRIPVDSAGNLTSPVVSGLASGTITSNSNLNFVFISVLKP